MGSKREPTTFERVCQFIDDIGCFFFILIVFILFIGGCFV